MYIVMNRFQVAEGREGEFEEIWRTRDSYLKEVDGFREFNLLRGEGGDFISHTIWGVNPRSKAESGAMRFTRRTLGPPRRRPIFSPVPPRSACTTC